MRNPGTLIVLLALLLFQASTASADGTVVRRNLNSTALGVLKNYLVYLPSGYGESQKRYPVIYLLHGLGVTEATWSESVNLVSAANGIKLQALVVMPDGDRGFYVNSVFQQNYNECLRDQSSTRKNKKEDRVNLCVKSPKYENYIVQELIEHIDRRYRTIPRREARAIAGESMGGFGAVLLALRNQSKFASVASHSGFYSHLYQIPRPYDKTNVAKRLNLEKHPNRELVKILGENLENWRAHEPVSLIKKLKNDKLAIYIDVGTEDEFGMYEDSLYFHDRLTELGIRHAFYAVPGTHHENLWRKRIWHSLRFHVTQFQSAGIYPAP